MARVHVEPGASEAPAPTALPPITRVGESARENSSVAQVLGSYKHASRKVSYVPVPRTPAPATPRSLKTLGMATLAVTYSRSLRLSEGLAVRRGLNLAAVLFALVGIGASVWAENVLFWDANVVTPMVNALKSVSTVTTLLLCVCVYRRRKLDVVLRAQHSLSETERKLGKQLTIRHAHILRPLVLELAVCAVHAPPFCHFLVTITAGDYESPMPASYSFDALASTWMVAVRPYLLVHLLHDAYGLNDVQAQMVGHWNNVVFDTWFTVRMLALEKAAKFISSCFFVVVATTSYLLRTWERPLCAPWRTEVPWFCSNAGGGGGDAVVTNAALANVTQTTGAVNDGTVNHNFIANSAWNIIITMTTVGYGDMYPNSHGGRTVATLAALLGITLVALAVDIIHKSMEFSRAEELAYRLVRVRRAKLVLQRLAAEVIQASARYWLLETAASVKKQRKSRLRLTNLVQALRGFRAKKQLIANLRGGNDSVVQAMSKQMNNFEETENQRHNELAGKVARIEASAARQEAIAEKTLRQLELLQAMVQELREPLTTTTSI